MATVTLTKEQMLEYWDAISAFPISTIKEAEKMNSPIPLDGLKKAVKENERIRKVIEQEKDNQMFILPDTTMHKVQTLISEAKHLQQKKENTH